MKIALGLRRGTLGGREKEPPERQRPAEKAHQALPKETGQTGDESLPLLLSRTLEPGRNTVSAVK